MTRIWIASSTILVAAMLSAGSIAPAAADTQALIDRATAAGLSATSYPGVTGPDQLHAASGT